MTNSLKKLISILSASAIAISIAPMALAEELEVASDAIVYYEENFDDIPSGYLANMTAELSTNTDYEDSKGITFKSAHRSDGDYYQIALNATSEGYLSFYAAKYTNAERMPKLIFSRTSGISFANDVVVTMDVQFPSADKSIIVKDSAGTSISVSAPGADYTGQWLTVTLASTDTETYKLVTDADGNVVAFETLTTILADVDMITVPAANVNNLFLDNLYIADETYAIPDSVVLDAAMNQITVSETQPGMTVEDGIYTVQRDVSLPAQPEGVTLEWVLEQSADGEIWEDTSYARVTNNKLIISPTEDSVNYLVRVTANVTCGDLTESKSFMFRVMAPDPNEPVVYYNEDFESMSGTLVDLSSSSNTGYESTNGLTFTCGSRDSDTAVTGANIGGSDDKYLNLYQQKYTGSGRQPVVTLSRTNGVTFTNNLVIKFNVTFADATTTVDITDSSNNTLKISAPGADALNTWISVEICKQSGNTIVVMKDESGNLLKLYTDKVKLSDVRTISTPDIAYSSLYIDDLYISDELYAISDETIVEAGLAALVLDSTQTNLAANGDEFDAKGDFLIPESPELTAVTWAVEEKALDASEWTASNFMSVSGTKVVINPTNEIDNYDVRLVATVTCGEVTDTKTFVINLPNPMAEVINLLASGYEFVESTDYTDAANTSKLTYDLNGGETLKFDLVLPTKVSGYRNSTIAWTSSDSDLVSINGSTATIMTDDLDEHDVTLTAVVTYEKGSVKFSSEPQNFNIKVGYTEEDIEDTENYYKGKYKVRFDAAYADNFEDIPEETTSNIDLPSKGKFGSKISWSSSAPSIISKTGEVSRATTDRDVTLTASIISGAGSEEKSFVVTVPKKKAASGGGGGGGGGSMSSTGTISKPGNTGTVATNTAPSIIENTTAEEIVSQLQEEAASANDLFTDLSSASWAREAINALAAAGIVNGKSDTNFAPNDTVTRAEFAKMLMGVFGLDSGAYATSSFKDVSTDAWYFNSVETAYNLGIITGIGDGKFAPNALITRQDMAVMVVRAANVCGVSIPEVNAAIEFADSAIISDYAKASVSALQKAGIINGVSDTEFAPLDNATRAQAAQILYNILKIAG